MKCKQGQTRLCSVKQRLPLPLVIASLLAIALYNNADAKKSNKADDKNDAIPSASVFGMAGERYLFYGTGGITVDQTPKPGFWHSNMNTYKISIDGGGGLGGGQGGVLPSANFATSNVEGDFNAFANIAYFVSSAATCTLPTASAAAGREILVCNTSKGGTISYNTTSGETVSGNQSGVLINSTPNKVDRFISDGKNWYRE
jgi:hypothetical protein